MPYSDLWSIGGVHIEERFDDAQKRLQIVVSPRDWAGLSDAGRERIGGFAASIQRRRESDMPDWTVDVLLPGGAGC